MLWLIDPVAHEPKRLQGAMLLRKSELTCCGARWSNLQAREDPACSWVKTHTVEGLLLAKGPKLCLDEVIPECLPNLRSGDMPWLRPNSRLGMYQQPQSLSLQTEVTQMGMLAHRNSSLPGRGWRPRHKDWLA